MDIINLITETARGELAELKRELSTVAVPYVVVLLAMCADLITSIAKAKKNGEASTSAGLRKTVTKFKEYYSMLFIATLMDVLLSVLDVYSAPFVTFGCGLYLTLIEGLSIRENTEMNTRRPINKDLKALVAILESRGDLVKALTDIVKNEVEEEKREEMKEMRE